MGARDSLAGVLLEHVRTTIERDPRALRLVEAETTASLSVRGTGQGITLRFDGERPSVALTAQPAEIALTLDEPAFAAFASGALSLPLASIRGQVEHDGPVRKLLRVDAVLREVLGAGRDAPQSALDASPAIADPSPDIWAIECRALRKSFGADVVLDGIDVGIPEGLITVVLGPSGTGKSVLLKHLVGLLKPDAGDVLVRGRSVRGMSIKDLLELRRRCGILFQDGALWASMNVFDNVALPLRQHTDLSEEDIAEIALARLADVGLKDAHGRMPDELSGGMRKRAGFARALVLDPELVFFDEPDTGLDPVRTALLCDLVRQTHRALGGTYLVITHDIRSARQIADYLVVLWGGGVVEAGPADDVLRSEDPFVRQFLAAETAGPLGMG